MSYCVHCGVELDPTASVCPLCHTPVCDPCQPVDHDSPTPFPSRKGEVKPVSKWEVTLLITVLLVSVSVATGVLNIFLHPEYIWSLYIIGAALMLWILFVPPLLDRKLPLLRRVGLDIVAVGLYVLMIAFANDGLHWFVGLALPIILVAAAVALLMGLLMTGRSILGKVMIAIGGVGVFSFFLELLIDRYLEQAWKPSWSLVVLAVCVAVIVPLLIIRLVPSLREEVRRRFHM